MKAIYDGFLRIAHTPLPTIAAVNGAAVGAGMNMVLACDLVLAEREYAKFDSRFLQIGIHPGGGHTWRLRQIAGRSTTMAMVMFNQILRAERAKEVGLAWEVIDDADLVDTAVEMAAVAAGQDRTQCPHESHDPHARHDHRVEPGGRLRDPPPAVVDGPAPFMELVRDSRRTSPRRLIVNEPGMVDVDVEAGETVLDVYERNGWGDGLPLEAPTPERVDAMLRTLAPVNGRPVDPDEVIAVLPPRSGEADAAPSRSTPCWRAADPSTCRCSSPRCGRSHTPTSTSAASTPPPIRSPRS